jgi:hypothetical protein
MAINHTFYVPQTAIPVDIDIRTEFKSTYCCFNKGYTPPPLRLIADPDGGDIRVVFERNQFTSTCQCQIECVLEATGDVDQIGDLGKFCPEDVGFEVTLRGQSFSSDAPTPLVFTFEDINGNISTIDVNSIAAIVPRAPIGMIEQTDDNTRTHAIVAVPLYSSSIVSVAPYVQQYQIQRYINNSETAHTWVDWTDVGLGQHHKLTQLDRVHTDRDILSGVDYGYRVRFRSEADNVSQWSAWLNLRA